MKLFPILESKIFRAIPWEVIEPHRVQVERNHAQTLERLAERGGLSPAEAIAALNDKGYYEMWPSGLVGAAENILLGQVVAFYCK